MMEGVGREAHLVVVQLAVEMKVVVVMEVAVLVEVLRVAAGLAAGHMVMAEDMRVGVVVEVAGGVAAR